MHTNERESSPVLTLAHGVIERCQPLAVGVSGHVENVVMGGAGNRPEGFRLWSRLVEIAAELVGNHFIVIAMQKEHRRSDPPDFAFRIKTAHYQRPDKGQ